MDDHAKCLQAWHLIDAFRFRNTILCRLSLQSRTRHFANKVTRIRIRSTLDSHDHWCPFLTIRPPLRPLVLFCCSRLKQHLLDGFRAFVHTYTSRAARGGAGSFKKVIYIYIYKSKKILPIEIVFDMLGLTDLKIQHVEPQNEKPPSFCFDTTVQHAEITTRQVVEKKQRQPTLHTTALLAWVSLEVRKDSQKLQKRTKFPCLLDLLLRSAKTHKSCKYTHLNFVNGNCAYLAVRKDIQRNTTDWTNCCSPQRHTYILYGLRPAIHKSGGSSIPDPTAMMCWARGSIVTNVPPGATLLTVIQAATYKQHSTCPAKRSHLVIACLRLSSLSATKRSQHASHTPVFSCSRSPAVLVVRGCRQAMQRVVSNTAGIAKSLSHMKRSLQCAEQQVSLSKLTKYCACHEKWISWFIIITHETLFTMRGVTSVIVQTHQILRLPRKMNLIIDPCHTWNALYNARSNKCHCPNSPNTAPATKNESHDWSLSHMKRYLQCAE